MKIYIVICGLVVSTLALAEPVKTFPGMKGWLSWLRVDYPERFEMDPKSFQGEAKWWAKFDDKAAGLSFEIDAFGYVNELELLCSVPGVTSENYQDKIKEEVSMEDLIKAEAKFKNIGDYFRAEILPKGFEETKFPRYERFLSKSKDRVVVYFLDNAAYQKLNGRCYQTLTFAFPQGTYDKHKQVIQAIIQSAKPPYGKSSEQDGDGQPGPDPVSK